MLSNTNLVGCSVTLVQQTLSVFGKTIPKYNNSAWSGSHGHSSLVDPAASLSPSDLGEMFVYVNEMLMTGERASSL